MEGKTYTPEQVAAAMAEAKVRMLEAGKSRLNALVELAVNEQYLAPAKAMVGSTLSELELILDSALMLSMESITLPMLQEARRTFYQNREARTRREKPE